MQKTFETHKESYLLEKECVSQRISEAFLTKKTIILQDNQVVQTAHLQCNHIKGPWANPNALAEVLEESAKEPDAADCRILSIAVI